jgi:ribosome-binding protein 1
LVGEAWAALPDDPQVVADDLRTRTGRSEILGTTPARLPSVMSAVVTEAAAAAQLVMASGDRVLSRRAKDDRPQDQGRRAGAHIRTARRALRAGIVRTVRVVVRTVPVVVRTVPVVVRTVPVVVRTVPVLVRTVPVLVRTVPVLVRTVPVLVRTVQAVVRI